MVNLDRRDWIYVGLVAGYSIFILLAWSSLSWLLYPFKLTVVAIHEGSHALMGKLTGATIHGISLSLDQGGLTEFSGGKPSLILPAGYLGSNLVGALLIFVAHEPNGTGALVASIALCIGLMLVLYKSSNWVSRVTTVGAIAVLMGFWVLEWQTGFEGTEYFVLFVGVMSCLYSIWDIYDDTIRREVKSSDASVFAERYPCLPSRGWGIVWGLISIGAAAGAAYLAIVAF